MEVRVDHSIGEVQFNHACRYQALGRLEQKEGLVTRWVCEGFAGLREGGAEMYKTKGLTRFDLDEARRGSKLNDRKLGPTIYGLTGVG
jgi:hypothetical protein